MTDQELAACYQPLYDHMYSSYGLILTITEMDEIIRLSADVRQEIIDNSFNIKTFQS